MSASSGLRKRSGGTGMVGAARSTIAASSEALAPRIVVLPPHPATRTATATASHAAWREISNLPIKSRLHRVGIAPPITARETRAVRISGEGDCMLRVAEEHQAFGAVYRLRTPALASRPLAP